MSDQVTPPSDQQAQAPDQQGNWEARYKGLVPTVERLTISNRELTSQLEMKTSELELLKSQLGTKDIEKNVAVSEGAKRLQEAIEARTRLETENVDLRAYQLKVKVIKDANAPHLLKILDTIPNMGSEEALKAVVATFDNYTKDILAEREKQLMAGVTPGVQKSQSKALPADANGWESYINSFSPGSKEANEAMEQYAASIFK